MLAAGFVLLLYGPSPEVRIAGAMLAGCIVTLVSMIAGVVMGNRLFASQPPVPSITEVDQTITGGQPDLADEIEKQLDLLKQLEQDDYAPHVSPFPLTAPETRG